MKIFYDWEFEENGVTIQPITLGMVAENGQYIYLYNQDYVMSDVYDFQTEWLKEHVINNLLATLPDGLQLMPNPTRGDSLAGSILEFVESLGDEKIELIADYADYDHVCLAQRFGRMINMPEVLPWVTYDLKQWCDDLGVEPPKQTSKPHNALHDAFYVKESYEWLVNNYEHPKWSKTR